MNAELRIVVYLDAAGEYRWRAVAANNRLLANGGEGYKNRGDVLAMVARLFPAWQVEDTTAAP